jgi:proteic killer suppression protein
MDVRFATQALENCYRHSAAGRRAWGQKIALRYVQRVNALYAAREATDLFALKSLRLHPLKGERKGQHVLSLDVEWRMVVRFEGESWTIVRVEEVSRHYGD